MNHRQYSGASINKKGRIGQVGTRTLTTALVALLLVGLSIVTGAERHIRGTRQDTPPTAETTVSPSDKTDTKEAAPFKFVVYGDTRDGHAEHRKIVELILKQKPDFVLQTGDLVDEGRRASLWKIYDNITGAMRAQVPVYPARGNHDLGGPGYEARVTAPFTSGTKLHYSFDKANCHFIALTVDEATAYGPKSAQYKWLIGDLEAAKQKAQHIFVFFHVPPYSIGLHGSDLEVRHILSPIFKKYGVRLVFNGHDHNYYHTERGSVNYIVTGGGGAPLYPCDPDKGALESDTYESVHHIVVCEVTGDLVAVTAIRMDGSQLDRFSLHSPVKVDNTAAGKK